jgi:hypothetical protein
VLRWPGARGQINLSFIDSTPVANLAALTGMARLHVFTFGATRTQHFGYPPLFVPIAGIIV